MTNILFYTLMFITFLQFSFGAISFSGVNRTFLNMYSGVLESSIITVDEKGEPTFPYFDEKILKENVYKYLDENLARYTNSYTTAIYFYDLDDGLMCTSHHCSGVRISLKADMNVFFKFNKAKTYFIRENSYE